MIYCISDIHGRIDLFEKMLDKINLKQGDTLYVLGDSIDRGGGLEVVKKCKELYDKGLLKYIQGNHEFNFIQTAAKGYKKKSVLISDINYLDELERQRKELKEKSNNIAKKQTANLFDLVSVGKCLSEMFKNVNSVKIINESIGKSLQVLPLFVGMESYKTISDVNNLSDKEFTDLLNFMIQSPFEEEVVVNGKKFILVHAGKRKTEDKFDILYNMFVRGDFYMNKTNMKNTTIIFGHTTTRDIKIKKYKTLETPYTIWYDDIYHDKICIDCGASYPNGQLACLRLDDMKEFYVVNERKTITPVSYINSKYEHLQNVYGKFLDDFQIDLEKFDEFNENFGGVLTLKTKEDLYGILQNEKKEYNIK